MTDTVEALISANAAGLTPAERKLTAELMREYPVSGLRSVTKLAGDAGVSTPTVIRLARKLGFDGFPEMQEALRREASGRISRAAAPGAVWTDAERVSPEYATFAKSVSDSLARTIGLLDPAAFNAVADLLADDCVRPTLHGGRLTRPHAEYFATLLQIIRPGVNLMPRAEANRATALLDIGPDTCLILFDIRRYDPDMDRLATLATARGARIVLLTDTWGSPIAAEAAHVLKTAVEAPSSWDTTLGLTFTVEALVAAVQERRRDAAQERIEQLEDLTQATRR